MLTEVVLWTSASMECVSFSWLFNEASILSTSVARDLVHDLASTVVSFPASSFISVM